MACLWRSLLACFVLLAALCFSACGDGDDTPAGPAARPPRAIPPLPEIPFADRVAYALERLERGPDPASAALRIPQLLSVDLELAKRDLLDMSDDTIAALSDPECVRRVTGRADTNPWHGVLAVLQALPDPPTDLVSAWTEPALEHDDHSIWRRAVRLLALVDDPAIAPLVFRYFERDPDDIESAQMAYRALCWLGETWAERATRLALRRGIPRVWARVPDDLTEPLTTRIGTPAHAALLCWTAALMEGSGPRPKAGLPRDEIAGWARARVWTDPQVPTVERRGPEDGLFRVHTYGPLPADVLWGVGWLKSQIGEQAATPPTAWPYTGKEPAANARCILALWGHEPFRKARTYDAATWADGRDDTLLHVARHCVDRQDEASARELNRDELALMLDDFAKDPSHLPSPTRLIALMDGSPSATDALTEAVLVRVIHELRPLSVFKRIVIRAHDALGVLGPDRRLEILTTLAGSDDPEGRAAALVMVRHARLPEYIPLLEAIRDDPETGSDDLWPQLVYLYSGAVSIEPDRLFRFLRAFEAWIVDVVIPRDGSVRAAALATGLLDFGDEGAEAYARLLRRADGAAYVAPLEVSLDVLPPAVVLALVDRAADETEDERVRQILALAWKRFPASQAALLSALRFDIPRRLHPMLDVAVERVRNRGPRASLR